MLAFLLNIPAFGFSNMLSDLIISAVCLPLYIKLLRIPILTMQLRLFRNFFLFMGLMGILSGILGHGYVHILGDIWRLPGWTAGALAVYFLSQAHISGRGGLLREYPILLTAINTLAVLVLLTITLITRQFIWMAIYTGISILGISFITNIGYSKINITGVGLVFLAAISFFVPFQFSFIFSNIDMSHLLLAAACILFYNGAVISMSVIDIKKTEPSA